MNRSPRSMLKRHGKVGLAKRVCFAFLAVILPISTLAVAGLVPGTSAIASASSVNEVTSVSPQASGFSGGVTATVTATLSTTNCTSLSSGDLAVYFGELTATPVTTPTSCSNGSATFVVTVPAYNGTQPSSGGVTEEVGLFNTTSHSFVTTPNPPSDQFTYGPPTITNVTPSTGQTDTATNPTVTVTGSGFDSDTPSNSAFYFIPISSSTLTPSAGTVGTTDSCSSTAQCQVTPPDLTAAGTYLVMAETEGNLGLTSGATPSSGVNEYTVEPAPAVTSVSPGSGVSGDTVTVNGTSFTGATEVDLYLGTTLSARVVPSSISSTSLDFTVPSTSTLANGTYALSVVTPYGQSTESLSNADAFTVGPPAVTSVSPPGGPAGKATPVTVGGSGFDVSSAGTAFYFLPSGDTPSATYEATSVACTSPTSCTMDTPAISAGTTTVVALTNGGESTTSGTSGANEYTFGNAPSVSSLDPAAIPTSGSSTILVSGTNLSTVTKASLTAVASTDGSTLSSPPPSQAIPSSDISCSTSGTTCTLTITPSSALANTEDLLQLSGIDGASSSTVSAADLLTVGAPVVTGVSPAGGPTSGGTQVTVSGYGFDIETSGNTAFYFGSPSSSTEQTSSANSTSNCSFDTTNYQFTCTGVTDPPATAGVVTVVAETNGGEATTSGTSGVNEFAYAAQPSVTKVSPDTGTVNTPASVTVSGANFVKGSTEFCFAPSGVSASSCPSADLATSVSVGSATSATMDLPVESAGTVTVYAITYGDDYSPSNPPGDQFTYGAPSLTSISPDVAPAGTGVSQSSVTVSGAGFALGTSATTFTFTSSSRVSTTATTVSCTSTTTCSVVPPDEPAGTYSVAAITAGGASSSLPFTYEVPPAISKVSPNAQVAGSSVTVTGTGFTSSTTFVLTNGGTGDYGTTGSVDCTIATSCTFSVPSNAAAGTYDVIAETAGGSSPVVQPGDELTVGPPAITSISPSTGSVYGGNTVTLDGTGFQTVPALSDTTITFTDSSATSVSATPQSCSTDNSVSGGLTVYGWQCQVVMPNATSILPSGGTVTATVSTTDGGSGPTSGSGTASYNYVVPPVALTGISPAAGSVDGGTPVTVTGTGMTNGDTSFTFTSTNSSTATVSASNVICNAAGTSCSLDTPPASDGPGAYTLTATDSLTPSLSSNGLTFNYEVPPAISEVSPNAQVAGSSVTVTGTDFTSSTTFVLTNGGTGDYGTTGSVDCTIATSCTFSVPSNAAPGTYDVIAVTTGGSSRVVQPGDELTVGPPAITSISPSSGSVYGGNTVTLDGTGFQTAPALSDTTITFTDSSGKSVSATPQSCSTDNSVSGGLTVYGWQCQVVMPNASSILPSGGTVTATVSTTDGGSGPTSGSGTASYNYVVPPVTLTGVSPAAGSVDGGTPVTVTGTGMTNGDTSFTFTSTNSSTATVSASNVICNAAGTSCSLDTPPASDGPGAYTLTATDSLTPKLSSNGLTFNYNDPPSVTAVNPGAAAVPSSVTVTVSGSNLDPQGSPASFSFGAIQATGVSCSSDTACSMTLAVPSDAIPSGSANLTVNVYATTTGSNTSSANPDHEVSGSVQGDQFTFGPPTITSVNPPAGSTSGGTLVTVTGTGFDPFGGTQFYFGPIQASDEATNVSCVSTTTCTMDTPDPSAGGVSVYAVTDGGDSSPLPDGFTYNPAPVVSSLSSDTGLAGGGETVSVTGSNFIVGSTGFELVNPATGSVIAPATGVACTSSTSCSFTTPAVSIPSGQANLLTEVEAVTTGGNTSAPNPPYDYFTFGPPTVTGVTPAAGLASGGGAVTVTGTGFSLGNGNTTIDIGTYPLTSVSCSSTTECTGTTSAGVNGTFNVYATTLGGTSASNAPADDFTYGPPSVTNVAPTAGPLSGGTEVVITGGGFVSGATVHFGALAATSVTFVSSTEVKAVSPSTSTAGAVDVRVTTLGGTSAIEEPADLFTYGPPSVTGVSPTAGPVSGGNTVTISGSGFTTDSTVYFGTSMVQTAISSYAPDQIKVVAPPGSTGPVNVTVANPVGTSALSGADIYVYGNPSVLTVRPNAGPTTGGTSVTIQGYGFTSDSTVDFGTTPASSVRVISDTEIMATSPAGSGVVNVFVTTPAGTSSASVGSEFSYGLPSVTSVTPDQGPTSGGTTVTIDGIGFGPDTSVAFGSLGAVSVTYVSPTEMQAVTPAESAGSVDVVVTNSAGSSKPNPPADYFTFGPAPTVTGLQPSLGPSTGGTVVAISGSSFQNVTAVDFGSSAASYTVVSSSEIKAVAPAGTGTVDVTVTATGLTSATNPSDQYTYVLPTVAGAYHPMSPVRIADTRVSSNPNPYSGDTLKPDSSLVVKVAGVDGIPAGGVTAVVANVTVVDPTANGYLTVYPEGSPPLASNVNFVAGAIVPNLVEVQLSQSGSISIYNGSPGTVNVIVDVEGYVSEAAAGTGLYEPIVPTRVADTRPASGEPYQGQALGAYSSLNVQVAGVDGIPATGIAAVVMNVTVTEPTASGYLTAYPAGEAAPLVSNLNFVPGQTVPNRAFVELGANGQVAFYNGSPGTVDIVVDVNGWFTNGADPSISGGQLTAMSPTRIVDTRANSGEPYSGDTLGPGQTLSVQVAGEGGVPAMSAPGAPLAVVANVTVTKAVLPPQTGSYLTVYPDVPQRPLASDLNWVGGQTVANLVVVKVGANGMVNFYNYSGNVDVVVDVLGWYSG